MKNISRSIAPFNGGRALVGKRRQPPLISSATTSPVLQLLSQRRSQSTTRANYLANSSVGQQQQQVRTKPNNATADSSDVAAAAQLVRAHIEGCDGAHHFVSRHVGPRPAEVREMLATLNYTTLDQLIDDTIPDEIRLKRKLNLPDALSEHELIERLEQMGRANSGAEWKSFIGLGYYDCVTPPAILRNIFENPGWTSAYTAYQAEIAQGRLESLMNYQTMVSDLTGVDVSNASLLDESTAAAEALQVCARVDVKHKRNKFLVSVNCHPQTKSVVETRAQALGIQVDYFNELHALSSSLGNKLASELNLNEYCGVLLQYPNSSGHVFDLGPLTRACQEADTLSVVATDLMACTLLKPPGDYDVPADLVVGSAQRFGVPLNFGGPHAAFLACRQRLIRSIPGRVVGVTRDSNGQQAYRFALQTREQHIRRDRATSNICTAQALLANMSAMYAIYHGPRGLQKIARSIHLKTSLLAHLIRRHKSRSMSIINDGAFFDTLTVSLESSEQQARLRQRAEALKLNLNYSSSPTASVSMALDETTKLTDVLKLASVFATNSGEQLVDSDELLDALAHLDTPVDQPKQLGSLKRQSSFLQHPTFNTYHSEAQLVRYMKQLENKDISLAHSMIPLGSCTMKLNATSQMLASSWASFVRLHPFQSLDQVKGYRQLFDELNEYLCEITGYDRISFQPNSGAQGEYAGLRVIRAYLESIGEHKRNVCLIPISAHGTNPASAQMAGMRICPVKVNELGEIDLADFSVKLNEHKRELACMMITYPSTFGVFEENISQLCAMVHEAGGQVYLDGANMNAQVGLCRPGDYGSDVSHLNLHKTFCIPHGGGGPGAGPIGVKRHLVPFLPTHPLVACTSTNNKQELNTPFGTISASMWGSPAILPISWSYIRLMSNKLRLASEVAILNANYMRKRLERHYDILYKGVRGNVAHEFIIDCRPFKKSANVEANDIAKRLQDFGLHAPTVSWPVTNTLMLEPTESEDKRQLDNYCDALLVIRDEIRRIEAGEWARDSNPLKNAPHTQQVVCANEWTRAYSREQAAFPAHFVRPESKIWPTVGRVDDTFGDTNLFCSCPPLNAHNNHNNNNDNQTHHLNEHLKS